MKKAETVTDDKGNIYVIPGQIKREEAELYFPNQPERSKREDLVYKEPNWVKMEQENYCLYQKYKAARDALECGALNTGESQ